MEIKEYEEMGYLILHGNEKETMPLPRRVINDIMKVITKPDGPKYINLERYGYGRESTSMIRGCKRFKTESQSRKEFDILKLPVVERERARSGNFKTTKALVDERRKIDPKYMK